MFGWTLGVGDGWGGLACCGSWGHKESATTEQLNGTELEYLIFPVSNVNGLASLAALLILSLSSPGRFFNTEPEISMVFSTSDGTTTLVL